MTACVFVGPTLRPQDARHLDGFAVLPPAAQGDVWRAAQGRPRALGIIDGYFEGVPAVWHKEILWAMSEGIHVFGSASIGALRAAELADFGMVGVGRIFEDFRGGLIEDDDEVAVLHGPADAGYVSLSEPMVNVRASLERAAAAGIVAPATAGALIRLAKGLFYQERTWPRILEQARTQGLDPQQRTALEAWLADGRVDQKRDDALAMLSAMRAFLQEDPPPKRVAFHFQWTAMWDDALRWSSARPDAGTRGTGADLVLEELKLDPDAFRQAREKALARLWARREAERRRLRPPAELVERTVQRLRRRHGLYTRRDLEQWVSANALDEQAFARLMSDEAQIEMLAAAADDRLAELLLDELRLGGAFQRLAARARAKAERLRAIGAEEADPKLLGLTPLTLHLWFFERRLGQPIPDDLDAFARGCGFKGCADFDSALAREYLYSTATPCGAQDQPAPPHKA